MGDGYARPISIICGQKKFILAAIDYFIKWIDVEALATITTAKIQGFVWKNVIYRFGIPRLLITNNGRTFDNYTLKVLGRQKSKHTILHDLITRPGKDK